MSNYINYRLVILSNKIFESIFHNRSEMYYPLEHTQIDYKAPDNELRKNLFVYMKRCKGFKILEIMIMMIL